jgi:flagellar hook-associated protein 1 FlgK
VLGDLFLALRTTQSGLIANQQALDVTARNIANANTPGYSAKSASFETRAVAGTGAGVDVTAVTRRVDEGLNRTLRLEGAAHRAAEIKSIYLDRIQTSFGSLDSNTSLSHGIAGFQAAIETFAMSPESPISKMEVVDRGEALASQFRSLSSDVQALRQETDQRIATAVSDANRLLSQINNMNELIPHGRANGDDVTTLEDQRDQALGELSRLIDARVHARPDGSVAVFTAAGHTLIGGEARELRHVPAAQMSPSVAAGDGSSAIDGIMLGDVDITGEINSGEVGGLIALRDRSLPNLQAGLDELASGLRDAVNQAHNRGTPYPGLERAVGTRAFADPTTETITFSGSADTRLVVFDRDGNQVATQTVRGLLGGPTATIATLGTTINTWLSGSGYGTAAIDGEGRLTMAAGAGFRLGLRDEAAVDAPGSAPADATIEHFNGAATVTGSGFSSFFGLNDFFVDAAQTDDVGVAASLAVRSDLVASPARVSGGATQWSADKNLSGAYYLSAGDGAAARDLASSLSAGASFDAAGFLPQMNAGFADYAASIVAGNARETEATQQLSAQKGSLVDALQHKARSMSGVNLDQELAALMQYEQAYTAAARVLSVIQSMFDALERAAP